MTKLRAAFISAALLALAGCSSDEERVSAAEQSMKAALRAAGFSKVTFGSRSGDGVARVTFRNVTAELPNGLTVSVEVLSLLDPDLSPMLPRWHDFGKIEIAGWELYGGHEPRPKGFRARQLTAESVRLSVKDVPVGMTTKSFAIDDFDSAKPGPIRYSGYHVYDMALTYQDNEIVRIDSAEGTARDWVDGLASPLKSKSVLKGSVSLASAGPVPLFPSMFMPTVGFTLSGESDLNLNAGTLKASGSLQTDGYGEIAMSLGMGGINRKLLELLTNASQNAAKAEQAGGGKPEKPKAGKKDKDKGKPAAPAPEADKKVEAQLAQAIMEASSSVSLTEMKIEGKGLEWLGPAIDAAFGSREIFATTAIRSIDAGFAGKEKSDAANQALAGIYLFIQNPKSFVLELAPQEPFVFGADGMQHYMNPSGGPLDALGFSFENRSE